MTSLLVQHKESIQNWLQQEQKMLQVFHRRGPPNTKIKSWLLSHCIICYFEFSVLRLCKPVKGTKIFLPNALWPLGYFHRIRELHLIQTSGLEPNCGLPTARCQLFSGLKTTKTKARKTRWVRDLITPWDWPDRKCIILTRLGDT